MVESTLRSHEVCLGSIYLHTMKNRDIYWRRCKIQETLYIGQWCLSPLQSRELWGLHIVLPIAITCPIKYSWISSTVWNLFPFKDEFSFGKSQKPQGTKSELYGGLSHTDDLTFHQKTAWRRDEAASHQLPIALWIIWTVSAEECSSLPQNLMQICCSTHSVIWMQWPHSTHAQSVASYQPHWLVQWSHHCSHLSIPVHSSWLPGYSFVLQTIFIILTLAGQTTTLSELLVVELKYPWGED